MQVNAPATSAALEHTIAARLTAIRYGARDTNFYEIAAADGAPLPAAEPGAHIGLSLPNGLFRQYSLIESDAAPRRYVIGVKRDAASRGGSSFMHDQFRVGSEFTIAAPRNNFPLTENAEHSVLFGGGIGVTPLYCMMQRLQALGRSWELVYSCRSRADALFLGELAHLPNVKLHFDDEAGGAFLPIAEIVARTPAHAHLYCCGPAPMMKAFEAATAGRPAENVHVEYFTPQFEAAQDGGFTVELAKSKRSIRIPAGKSILHALRAEGLDMPHSCEEGVCGACETRVLAGEPDHRDSILSTKERAANKTMMICCSGCKGDKLVLDI